MWFGPGLLGAVFDDGTIGFYDVDTAARLGGIDDAVQALDYDAANRTALFLLGFSLAALAVTYALQRRVWLL